MGKKKDKKKEKKELVSMTQNEFSEAVTPKVVKEDMFFFNCPDCGGIHFRHAGYLETLMPYVRADGGKRVCADSSQVKVCVKCMKSYVWINDQMWDVTDRIDLKAWEKAEKKLHETTGPGGEC